MQVVSSDAFRSRYSYLESALEKLKYTFPRAVTLFVGCQGVSLAFNADAPAREAMDILRESGYTNPNIRESGGLFTVTGFFGGK